MTELIPCTCSFEQCSCSLENVLPLMSFRHQFQFQSPQFPLAFSDSRLRSKMRILKECEYLSRFAIAFGDSMQKVKLLRGVYRSGWKLLGVLYGYLRCCRRSMEILYLLTAAFRVTVASLHIWPCASPPHIPLCCSGHFGDIWSYYRI
jgi:hypothetical protein